jgi:hypothetical protein
MNEMGTIQSCLGELLCIIREHIGGGITRLRNYEFLGCSSARDGSKKSYTQDNSPGSRYKAMHDLKVLDEGGLKNSMHAKSVVFEYI